MRTEDPLILLVDDNDDDAMLVRIAFQRAGFTTPLHFARDGEEAVAYLRGDGPFADRQKFPLPTAVLLDLNLPRQNGFEVLAWVRHHPEFRRLWVYILSASSRADDIQLAYDFGANSYLVKPSTMDELTALAKGLLAWLRLCHFYAPEESGAGEADDQARTLKTSMPGKTP